MVERRWPAGRGVLRGTAEVLELLSALVPPDRHEGEDEVGLVERDSLRVDPNEDLGDLLLVDRARELKRREGIALEVVEAVDRLVEMVLLVVIDLSAPAQPFQELLHEPIAP